MAFFSLDDVTFRAHDRPVLAHTSWSVERDERWAVLGPNGSGKSLLLQGLAGRLVVSAGRLRHQFLEDDPRCRDSVFGVLPRGSIELVSPGGGRRLVSGAALFHQARWHASEAHGARVADLLSYEHVEGLNPFRVDVDHDDRAAFEARRAAVVARLGLEPLLERELLELSNGEQRKLLLARALCRAPKLLLVDDPFTGLDALFRAHLGDVFAELIAAGTQVLIATRRADEIPAWVTHVLRLDALRVVDVAPRADVFARLARTAPITASVAKALIRVPVPAEGEALVEMHNVRVQYGATIILDGIDWTVRSGEHWAVVGANGAGKSTLLSLILGDNPQVYANDVRLFGRRRGSGENIWELRQRIGWTGPELDVHFPMRTRCLDAVCSGWAGTLGLHAEPRPAEVYRARDLLRLFAIETCADEPLSAVGEAERRLVFIARALVRRPSLLVLDEPCQGLDGDHVALVRLAVEAAVSEGIGSVLYVTHMADELPECIQHRLALDAGRVASSRSVGQRPPGVA